MKEKMHRKLGWLYKRLYLYVKPLLPVLFLGIIANMFCSIIDAGFTYLMRPFLDKAFVQPDIAFVKQIPLIVLVGITLRGLFNAGGGYAMTWVTRSGIQILRQSLFAHIVHLPSSTYDRLPSGKLLSKILYDVEQVSQVSADVLTDLVQNICLIIGLLVVMMLISWQLSLMFLFIIPFIAIVVRYTSKRIRRISHQVQKSMGLVTEIASEAIEGYRVVRIFGGETHEINKFNQAAESSRVNDMKVASSKALNTAVVQIIIGIGIATIVLSALKLSTIVTITAGSFLAIIASMLQLIKPLKTLTTISASIQRGLAGAESVFNLLDLPSEPEGGGELHQHIRGEISFQNVSFTYRRGKGVLHNVSFNIRAGETVALVGHSGCGKSTIVSLIPRFYEATAGQITLDGIPISHYELSTLRHKMALVTQQVTLFNDTIMNNIAYARNDVDIEEVIKAAKLAYADEFIQKLPKGYYTRIGENGVLLSGGQRQRLAIARAIMKDAPILILDEATSALDSESERYIQLALEQVMKNRTTVVVAHRLSTIKSADRIVVLHQGQIVEQGTHHELLAMAGHYSKLYQHAQETIQEHEVALV